MHPLLSLAIKEGMLDAQAARQLDSEGQQPASLALERGLLTPLQVDVLNTLLRGDDAVPGYVVLGLLGFGGMGVVYRARQKALGREVALKTILLGHTQDPRSISRFQQEALAIGKLQHPQIVAAYDFGRHEGRLYLAMELIRGEDLDTRVHRDGALAEPEVWAIARQVASGLAHAAAQGVFHRDIKPANLLAVDPPAGFPLPRGQKLIKIADFGLAFLNEDSGRTRLTGQETTLGSPYYLAPDQFEAAEVDQRADIYSLGATVYHLLGGVPPFRAPTIAAVLARKIQGDPESLRERGIRVSEVGERLLSDMLQRDRSLRISDYGVLLSRIDEVLAQLGGEARPGSPRPGPAAGAASPARPSGGRRARRIAWACLLTLGLALAWWNPWLGSGARPKGPQPGANVYRQAGPPTPLFRGDTLDGFTVLTGTWRIAKDEEGASVIEGASGLLRRPLAMSHPDGRRWLPRDFTVALRLHPRSARAVELQFNLAAPRGASDAAPRHALRIEGSTATLGLRSSESAPFTPMSTPTPVAPGPLGWYVMQLELAGGQWIVRLDERELGGVPAAAQQVPEFRLLAEAGEAWFADIELQPLEAVEKPPVANAVP